MSIIDAFSTEEKEEVKLAGQVLNKAGLTIMNAESKSTPPIVDQIIQKGPKTFSDITRNARKDILEKGGQSQQPITSRG